MLAVGAIVLGYSKRQVDVAAKYLRDFMLAGPNRAKQTVEDAERLDGALVIVDRYRACH